MDIIWDTPCKPIWNKFHQSHGGALQQAWAYGEAVQLLGTKIHRAIAYEANKPVAIAQFLRKRIAGYISLSNCSRGPIWHPDLSISHRQQIYRQLKQSIPTPGLKAILFSPDLPADTPDSHPETAHLSRVMTGYSTVIMDLSLPMDILFSQLEGKWRNRLRAAERSPGLQIITNASLSKCRLLLERENQQRQQKNFHGLPTLFVENYIQASSSRGNAFALSRAEQGAKMIAGMLFLIHGRMATYHIGWADETGRQMNVHNLLLWNGMAYLRDNGVTQLDLGGVNTHQLPGLSRFKLGTGGKVVTYAGTFY